MDDPARWLAVILTGVWALAVTAIDVRTRRISLPLAGTGLIPVLVTGWVTDRWIYLACGALGLVIAYFVLRLISPSGLGGGDLRLAPVVGALTAVGGPWLWVLATVGAFLMTAAMGLVVLIVNSDERRAASVAVPHGPSMGLTAIAALCLAIF